MGLFKWKLKSPQNTKCLKLSLTYSTHSCLMFGEYINNLRYADDTVLLAENEEELQTLVNAVKEGSLKYGLEMNIKKTKTMVIRKDINEVDNQG